MNRFIVGAIVILLCGSGSMGYAQQSGAYSTGAYSELGKNDSYLDRISDWFATSGKSRDEKIMIMSQRRAARKMAAIQKTLERKKREIARQKREAMNR